MADLDRGLLAPRRAWRRALTVIGGTVTAVLATVMATAWVLRPLNPPGRSVVYVQPAFATASAVDASVCAAVAEPVVAAPAAVAEPPPAPVPAPASTPTGGPVAPSPFAFDGPRVCPPPRTDAPRIAPPALDERIDRLVVAPSNAGWVAAWNGEHVFVSTDAGAHFERVLDGPGAVSAVGFDCFGTVIVVRTPQALGLRVGGVERWQTLAGVELMDRSEEPAGHAALVSGGPEIVIVGRRDDWWNPRVAISSDLGHRWRYHDLDASWEAPIVRGRAREDGSIEARLPSADCMGDGEAVVSIRRGAVAQELGGAWPALGHRLELEPWPAGLPDDATWAGDALARAGDALYRLRGGRAARLPVVADELDGELQLDAAGRVWSIRCGAPIVLGKRPIPVGCPDGD
jgi:hypothetical protein